VRRTYAEVERGQVLALVGSTGHLEIAVREGDAAQTLGLRPGDAVALYVR
jgi:S-adenosylmethionine hydrolase